MSFLFGTACIIAILFMTTFIFIGIWLFVIALKAFKQLRYKNYILEKIYQKLDVIANKNNKESDLFSREYMDLLDLDNEDEIDNIDNIKDFDKFGKIK